MLSKLTAGIVAWVNSTWMNLKEIDEDCFKLLEYFLKGPVKKYLLGWVGVIWDGSWKYFSCLDGPPFFFGMPGWATKQNPS